MDRYHSRPLLMPAILVLLSLGLMFAADAGALSLKRGKKTSTDQHIPLGERERCPVCGMFVKPYPKWITQIQFMDGSHHSFDGMKCMSRFYLNPQHYVPEKKKADIKLILVRDYYTLKYIPHDTAFYVVGSDVLGPMGHELIPFDTLDKAETFSADHGGVKILRFDRIGSELLDRLDQARKKLVLE